MTDVPQSEINKRLTIAVAYEGTRGNKTGATTYEESLDDPAIKQKAIADFQAKMNIRGEGVEAIANPESKTYEALKAYTQFEYVREEFEVTHKKSMKGARAAVDDLIDAQVKGRENHPKYQTQAQEYTYTRLLNAEAQGGPDAMVAEMNLMRKAQGLEAYTPPAVQKQAAVEVRVETPEPNHYPILKKHLEAIANEHATAGGVAPGLAAPGGIGTGEHPLGLKDGAREIIVQGTLELAGVKDQVGGGYVVPSDKDPKSFFMDLPKDYSREDVNKVMDKLNALGGAGTASYDEPTSYNFIAHHSIRINTRQFDAGVVQSGALDAALDGLQAAQQKTVEPAVIVQSAPVVAPEPVIVAVQPTVQRLGLKVNPIARDDTVELSVKNAHPLPQVTFDAPVVASTVEVAPKAFVAPAVQESKQPDSQEKVAPKSDVTLTATGPNAQIMGADGSPQAGQKSAKAAAGTAPTASAASEDKITALAKNCGYKIGDGAMNDVWNANPALKDQYHTLDAYKQAVQADKDFTGAKKECFEKYHAVMESVVAKYGIAKEVEVAGQKVDSASLAMVAGVGNLKNRILDTDASNDLAPDRLKKLVEMSGVKLDGKLENVSQNASVSAPSTGAVAKTQGVQQGM